MLLFRSEEHVDRWCEGRGLTRQAILSFGQLWGLAKAFYSNRLALDARRLTRAEVVETFERLALTGPFWRV